MIKFLLAIIALVLAACTGYPKTIQPVDDFELNRYLGTWYEIARLDHSFERGLRQVTAQYSLREDGGVRVINSGVDEATQESKTAEGKAYFVEEDTRGYFKVSFFGPFYGAYVIFELDDDYQTAFVGGNTTEYLWLLSRTPTVSEAVKQRFLTVAEEKGYAVDELIFVDQASRE